MLVAVAEVDALMPKYLSCQFLLVIFAFRSSFFSRRTAEPNREPPFRAKKSIPLQYCIEHPLVLTLEK